MSSARQFGTISRLPSGRYQARDWQLGEQVSAGTTFPTKTAARAWLSSVETDLRRGDHIDPRGGAERFGVYARRWLEPVADDSTEETGPRTPNRFCDQRERPGELIHLDVKKIAGIPHGGGWRLHGRGPGPTGGHAGVGYRFIHTALDDRTRLAYSESSTTNKQSPPPTSGSVRSDGSTPTACVANA